MRSLEEQMDMFNNQDDIQVQEIAPEGVMAGPMPDVNAPEYQEMRKDFATDVAKGAATSPFTGAADIVEMGAAIPESATAISPMLSMAQQGFEEAAKYVNREVVEQTIKDVTGVELKGTAGEMVGEVVGLPGGGALVGGIGKIFSKYGDKVLENLDAITDEARELFRTASGGDGTDGMAMATAGASRETVPTGVKPDLPDTSVTPMMIGESTPRGQEAAENYNRAKELNPDLSEEDLFAQTGVYEGPDGKLRSELPTTDATINTDVFEKLKSGDTTETTLEELVDYPKLFNAYREEYYDGNKLDFVTPSDLGSIKVRLNTDDDFAGAYYSNYPNQGELIELNGKLNPDELRATLLHEVQHAIQRREGFTSGANTEMFYPTVSEDLGLGRLSKDRYLRDLERVNDTLENADAMVFKPLKNIAKTVFGGKADLNNPLRNFDFDEQYMLMEVIPDIALERHKRQKFSRFGSFTPIQTYKITKEDVAKYLQDKSNLYNFKTQYLDVPDDEILEYEVSPEVIENFVNKAGKILNNPKLTPDVLRANLHGKVNTMKELDLLRTIPSRARLEYKRKYGELEAELIEKRDARRQALRQLTDMSDSQIEEQMREEFPPLGMEIQEAIARANPQFMKGLTAKDGKVQVPPEKARLDDDSPVAFSASARPDVDETVDTMTAAGLDDASIADWRKANATSEEFRKRLKGRNTTLIDLANKLKAEDITAKEYRQVADAVRPIRVVEEVPKPATTTEVVSALGKKSEKGVVGVNRSIPEGDRITARLDINAYTDYDVWIPTLTHPEKKTIYSPTVVLRDVSFIQPDSPAVKKAMNVATGQAKAPFAVMEGNYRSMSDSDAFEYAKQAFDDESWTQVGYDPTRRGFFYDRKTGEPVLNAEEVVQVGHLVLAKNAVKGDADDFPFNKGGAVPMKKQMELFEPVQRGFNEGGFEDGGLKEEGGSVDPVSGNDVPPGSTQKEVRDDIPAQLSEGEFVFPADVVRYIGLEKLMQMRQEAKRGLDMMDKMGQMGNSDEAVIPDDIPFELSDLDMEDDGVVEFAQGGVVNAQVGAFIPQGVQFAGGNTFQSQVMPSVNTPPPVTTMPVTQLPTSTYQAPTQAATPTYDYRGNVPTYDTVMSPTQGDFGGATGAAEVITIVNATTGEKRQINFIPGVTTIPEGFVRESEYKPTETKTQTATGTGVSPTVGMGNNDDDPSVAPEFTTTDVTGIGYDRSKIKNEDLLGVLNASAKGQVAQFSVLGNTARALGQEAGLMKGSGPLASAVLGGVLDQIRGGDVSFASGRKSGDYENTMSLGNMTNQQQQMIADVFKDVTVRMEDIYTTTNEKGEKVNRSEPEIVERLQSVASKNYGIDLNRPNGRAKSRTTLEREIANRIAAESRSDRAKDAGQAKRDTAKAMAAALPEGYKIDTTDKSAAQIRKEVGQQRTKYKEDQARAERERAAAAAEAARGDYDYSSGDPDPFGGTGSYGGSAAEQVGAEGGGYQTETGEAMVAEGGLMDKGKLAKQMKRSGLASKK